MELVIDLLSWVFLLGGAFFMLVAGIGVLRLPDIFTRMHAAGVKDTSVRPDPDRADAPGGFSLVTAKLLLIWLFLWFTSPVASHAVARRRSAWWRQAHPGDRRGSRIPPAAEAARTEISEEEGDLMTFFVDVALLALLAVTGTRHAPAADLFAVVILSGIYSLLSAGLFVTMDAPDVAFTESAVGVGVSPPC
jgi:multicomponent Na+:H+ antiporter subunit G